MKIEIEHHFPTVDECRGFVIDELMNENPNREIINRMHQTYLDARKNAPKAPPKLRLKSILSHDDIVVGKQYDCMYHGYASLFKVKSINRIPSKYTGRGYSKEKIVYTCVAIGGRFGGKVVAMNIEKFVAPKAR